MSTPKQCPELPTAPELMARRPRRNAAQKAREKIAVYAIEETQEYVEEPYVQPSYKNVDWKLSTVKVEEITIRCGWKRYFNINNSSMIFKKGKQSMNVWLKGKGVHFISMGIKPMNLFRKELSLDDFEAILVDKSKNILTDQQIKRIEMNKQRALQRLAENKAKKQRILQETSCNIDKSK